MAQTINVDISTRGAPPVAYTHQGDTDRTFLVNLFENGEVFAVAGFTVKVAAILPGDGGYTVISGADMVSATKTTTGTNQLMFTPSAKYTARSGRGILTLIMTTNTGTPATLRPINIDFRIQKSADGEDVIAGASDFPEGLEAIAESVFQEYLSTYLPPVAPSSSADANKAASAKLTGEELSNLKSDLTKYTGNESFKYTQHVYFPLDGTTASTTPKPHTADIESVCVPCSEGDVFYINAVGAGNKTRAFGFISADGTVLNTSVSTEDVFYRDFKIVAPANSAYLLSNNYYGGGFNASLTKNKPLVSRVSELVSRVSENETDLNYLQDGLINFVTNAEWEAGTLNGDGLEIAGSGFFRTSYIDRVGFNTVDINVGENAVFIFEYNENETFIKTTEQFGGMRYTENATHTFNGITRYFRIVTRKNPVDESSTIAIVRNIDVTTRIELLNAVDRIEDALHPYLCIIAEPSDLNFNGYINSSNGERISNTVWKTSDYIELSDVDNITVTMSTFESQNTAGIAFYDSTKSFVSGVAGNVTGEAGYNTRIIEVPSNAVYVRFSFRVSDIANFIAKKDEFYELEKNNTSSINTYGMQQFEKIGVISDSISVGWAKDKNGNNSRRNTGISWVQQMARRLGCTAYNLGASGVDPIEWFQSNFEFAQYCYQLYQTTEACDLYIIGLGLNGGTLGTTADINQSDYTQNAETFYGQYARIIQMINHDHPNAIVMCLTEPTTRISDYDQAVRNICALSFINAELVDLENDYFDLFNTPEILAQHQPDGLHFTPYGYSLLADAMMVALNDYISKHTNKFKYVGVATV